MSDTPAPQFRPANFRPVTTETPLTRWLLIASVVVVLSVLLGTGLGGLLVSDLAIGLLSQLWPNPPSWWVDTRLAAAFALVLVLYALAALLNIGVPRRAARLPVTRLELRPLLQDFRQANRQLWLDPLGGLSLAVTTLFWGAGAVLQFAVLRWAQDVIGLALDRAAYLQACVAIGVVVGAGLAAHRIALNRAATMLPWGVALGLLVVASSLLTALEWALPLLVVTGAVGGLLVVPMNALLQYRGHRLLSPGRSIAVQGFNENLSVLVMLGLYTLLLWLGLPIVPLMVGFGLLLAAGMAGLMLQLRLKRT